MNEDDLKIRTLPEGETWEPATASSGDIRRQWLEARVRSLYMTALQEEIPEALTSLVLRLGRAN